jgi:hypothetical protein
VPIVASAFPELIDASGFLRSPNFSTRSRATMPPAMGLATISRNHANGSDSVNRTVYRSSASILAIERYMEALLPVSASMRWNVNFTSSALSSRPFHRRLVVEAHALPELEHVGGASTSDQTRDRPRR